VVFGLSPVCYCSMISLMHACRDLFIEGLMGEWDLGATIAERSFVGEMPCAGLDNQQQTSAKSPCQCHVNYVIASRTSIAIT
jgi:hypothetical protein